VNVLIQRLPSSYNRRSAILTLQTAEELALTSDDLMRLVDNMQGVRYQHETESYQLTGDGFGPDRYFGGGVKALSESQRQVDVWID
jgi:hypothetical protein